MSLDWSSGPEGAHGVDLEAYPITSPERSHALCQRLGRQLEDRGCAELPGFLTASACQALVAEVEQLLPRAHARDARLTAYSEQNAQALPSGAPPPQRHRFCMQTIAYDQLASRSLLARLYSWEPLTRFIHRAVGGSQLYPCQDPLLSCVVTVMTAGGEHGWHFDDNDFVVSILLKEPDAGGRFELVPNVADQPDLVASIMDGERSHVMTPTMRAGTFILLAGRRGLHRVSPVEAGRRIIALMSYDRRPGMCFADQIRINVLGRAH